MDTIPFYRFWSKVDFYAPARSELGPCWVWTAALKGAGYGVFRFGGKLVGAHVVSYELLVGQISSDKEIDHLCGNMACVNPAHLEPVTHRENLLRGRTIAAAHASRTHCPQGHPYEGRNLYVYRGMRMCRTCRRARNRATREGS